MQLKALKILHLLAVYFHRLKIMLYRISNVPISVTSSSAVWILTMPIWRRLRWVFVVTLVVILFFGWLIHVGDYRANSVATFVSLEHEYGLVSWELENVFAKWTHRIWAILPWTPSSDADRRSSLDRYVVLVDELREANDLFQDVTSMPDSDARLVAEAQDAVDQIVRERDEIRDEIEEYLEQIIAEIVTTDDVDLVQAFVWPPVDFRIDNPPKLLVTSPRNEIRRVEGVLIDPDISASETLRIESELSELHDLSALIIQTGGLASFPSVIPTVPLKRLVDIACHEWLHGYLMFYPFGRAYFVDDEMRSVNETLADVFGREVGQMVYSRIFDEPYVAPVRPETAFLSWRSVNGSSSKGNLDQFNFNQFMSETRQHTDSLLLDGLIEEAEAYMETRRIELLGHGYSIRKINQAYFAFHGTYAESPSSSSPIASYIWDLREQVDTVGELVKMLRGLTAYDEFEQLLVDRGIELEQK